ncbi:YbbR-like domain-containing protein [Caproiciproducens galactitolivorans]|uniref:CdaR family protein n=1 Tax=Caproiciproducens galactitolivorans TaxID=642589 RepID=A0ABT4BVA8_9FIRM|nr:CdaR family protein [Caproiciproducens galactitolivorans]MCY1714816.1 CdaR family protein [Caproiciproducens galactitolivorans]
MKIKKFSIGSLFYNNKFVMFFSVLAAIGLWIFMALTNTEEFPRQIQGVPITIRLSDAAQADGLKVFSPVNQTATVSIKGNSLIVKQIQPSDLEVVAQLASTITSPGNYTFNLSVNKKGTLSNFDVVSISPNQANISVDRYAEKTFPIENDMKYKSDYKSDPSYFVSAPTFSVDTVTVSGPEKEVSRVNKVSVQYEINDTLRESKSFTTDLILTDANGNKVASDKIKMSQEKVDVTIPVLSRIVLPLSVDFTNKPTGLALSPGQITISPQSIEVAGPKDVLSNLTEISLAPIDFSGISPTTSSFDVNVSLPASCKNLSNVPVAKVTLDLGSMATRKMVVSNFAIKNLAADKTASVYTKSLTVTVVGPESEISKLTENSLSAQIDMAGKENFTGHTEMPVSISVGNATSSWVYGSYMANISVSPIRG